MTNALEQLHELCEYVKNYKAQEKTSNKYGSIQKNPLVEYVYSQLIKIRQEDNKTPALPPKIKAKLNDLISTLSPESGIRNNDRIDETIKKEFKSLETQIKKGEKNKEAAQVKESPKAIVASQTIEEIPPVILERSTSAQSHLSTISLDSHQPKITLRTPSPGIEDTDEGYENITVHKSADGKYYLGEDSEIATSTQQPAKPANLLGSVVSAVTNSISGMFGRG